jgi:hypothetical protein
MRRGWALGALAACGTDPAAPTIEAGDYQFYTLAAVDGCLDGALEALFMPEGRDAEHAFEFPIYVPTQGETPISYNVDFRAPFLGMPVTVEATDTGLSVRGSVLESVLLDEDRYGDCVVTMGVDVDLEPAGAGQLTGEARLDLADPRGDEGRCPALDADPCRVTLTIRAERIGDGSPE